MLGISVYPHKSTTKEIKEYITLAHKYGYKRIFSCLLSHGDSKENVKKGFKEWIDHANSLEMEVMLDVAPVVFKKLEIELTDLSFFHELGVYGLRLDDGFGGQVEAQLTRNPYGIYIEINLSNDVSYPNIILDYDGDRSKLIGCHNFYPQEFSGLSREYFNSCNKRYKTLGLKTAAFISSNHGDQGPWNVTDGLCTLEEHRTLPITSQAKDYLSNPEIDTILIGNAYATEEELKAVSELSASKIELDVEVEQAATEIDIKIMFDSTHFRRGDLTEYFVRVTKSRVEYKDYDSPLINTPDILYPGDVVVGTNNIGKYKNELQIILKEHKNRNQRKRLIAKVKDYDIFLLGKIKPWTNFGFKKIK